MLSSDEVGGRESADAKVAIEITTGDNYIKYALKLKEKREGNKKSV